MRFVSSVNYNNIRTFYVLTGSSCTDGSHVQNIKGVSVYKHVYVVYVEIFV